MLTWIKNCLKRVRNLSQSGKAFFYRIIWMACISISIPIVLAGIFYYYSSSERAIQQIMKDNQNSLMLITNNTEKTLQDIDKASLELAVMPLIKDSFSHKGLANDYVYQISILDAMLLQKNRNNMIIDEIYYYNDLNKVFLSNTYSYIGRDDFKFKDDVKFSMDMKKPVGWLRLANMGEKDYLYFVRQLPTFTLNQPEGVIIVGIKEKNIRHFFYDSNIKAGSPKIVVLDPDNQIFLNSDGTDAANKAFITSDVADKVTASTDITGSFFMEGPRGKQIMYTFTKTVYGRTYISFISKSEVEKNMNWVNLFNLLAVFVFIGIGILLTILYSKRIYNPIEQLMKYGSNLSKINISSQNFNEISFIRECFNHLNREVEALDKYVSKAEPTLREQFYLHLIDENTEKSAVLHKEMDENWIPKNQNYCVLIASYGTFYNHKIFKPNDKSLVSFSVTNIMEELLEADLLLQGHIINDNQGRSVVMLNFDQDISQEEIVERIKQYAELVHEAVLKYLSFDLTIGIGRIYSNIYDVWVSYREALSTQQYRFYKDMSYILFIDELDTSRKHTVFFYPRDIEALIIDSLASNDENKFELELKKFSDVLRASESYNLINQSFQMLLSAAVSSFQQKGGNIFDLLENNLFDQLKECQTTQEICDWFSYTLFPIYKKLLAENEHSNVKSSILKICVYVKENISNDVSLVKCSEYVGMSPSYISRIFKRELGMSFMDYVTNCKIDKVKKLLLESDMSINDIAENIGYSDRNLYRIFQRAAGMSPNEFRRVNL